MKQTIECSNCHEDVPIKGAFRPCADELELPVMCFACVFVLCLNGAPCGLCGSPRCSAFVAAQTDRRRIEPRAVCPTCMVTLTVPEEVLIDAESREPIPEFDDARKENP